MKMALQFDILAKCAVTKARVASLKLPHAEIQTPVFMPVGTQGTIKGLTPSQIEGTNTRLILGNTYHLGLRPGEDHLNSLGGLHEFMKWKNALLTDSGGFQMVSLLHLAEITEEGVQFQSPRDGSMMMLTPEKSIALQNAIGADIIMQLDDVVSSLVTGERVEEAMNRTLRWLDRSIAAHKRPHEQNLFGIVQGGLNASLRKQCAVEMIKRDLPGYAIGGLSGGEDKDMFWQMIDLTTNILPECKPRYCMGVGYAVDLVVCSALGADMFDCVFPTRTARFGNALTPFGTVSLRHAKYVDDFKPIDSNCNCLTCRRYTRSFLHSIVTKETVACHLISIHNLAYQAKLMESIRDSICSGTFPAFIQKFMLEMYPDKKYPSWAMDAFRSVNVELL